MFVGYCPLSLSRRRLSIGWQLGWEKEDEEEEEEEDEDAEEEEDDDEEEEEDVEEEAEEEGAGGGRTITDKALTNSAAVTVIDVPSSL